MLTKCVFVEWFQFEGRCPITTCKYSTPKNANGCLAQTLGATDAKKVVSDQELRYHKFPNLTLSQVQARRKEAVLRVKRILVLHQYLEFLRENCKLSAVASPALVDLAAVFPFKLKKLGASPELLAHVGDATFAEFAKARNLKENLELTDILFLTKRQWQEHLEKRINERAELSRAHPERP